MSQRWADSVTQRLRRSRAEIGGQLVDIGDGLRPGRVRSFATTHTLRWVVNCAVAALVLSLPVAASAAAVSTTTTGVPVSVVETSRAQGVARGGTISAGRSPLTVNAEGVRPIREYTLGKADTLLIGGGMVFTFLKAQGHEVGKSLLEDDQLDTVRGYLERAEEQGVTIVLPTDIVVDTAFPSGDRAPQPRVVPADEIPAEGLGLDIGPDSARAFAEAIAGARTVFWNGPMGVFETPEFADGTRAVAAALTKVQGLSVVGGGDSAAAVRTLGFDEDAFGHISTGGGASLEFLEGKELPGIAVLER